MLVVVTGAGGQLGRALVEELRRSHQVVALDHRALDITCADATERLAALQPASVIHAAAWTDVDGCARDPQRAFRVNVMGTRAVALACQRVDARMAYISTNEVFDGTQREPYREDGVPGPVNAYGASKLAGERATRELVGRAFIIRTSWVYGPGGRNFPAKVLELSRAQPELPMVADEIASPTYTPDLAGAIARLLAADSPGIYQLTNQGSCSRYDFARAVLDLAGFPAYPLRPIAAADFPRASRPPLQTALHNRNAAGLGITLRPWREALAAFLSAGPPR
ncbi:MAG: dTDP-4-dehydrorhamnose reductase [Chloroflexi bacterium]|nr:dTDP-4-dehydrorhamnose reductase [Chloroflexota bacterium]